MTTLEIAVTNVEDAIAAQAGGADSVELSVELERDGLTPPLDLVEDVCAQLYIKVHVIVRPHDRDFIYTSDEIDGILADTEKLVNIGVDGIVFGAHTPDKTLDLDAINAVIAASAGRVFTLHRAIDSAHQPEDALRELAPLIDRILTSGPAANAWEGRHGLKGWCGQFGDQLKFIAAGGVKAHMLPELVRYTGVSGIHVGSGATENGIVTVQKVRELKALLG